MRNKLGQFIKGENVGASNTRWNGGKTIDRYGYIKILDYENPMSDSKGYVYEHRLVMSKKLGRFLTKKDYVHHINGIKTDNQIKNLELMTQRKHKQIHAHPENLPHPSGIEWHRLHNK